MVRKVPAWKRSPLKKRTARARSWQSMRVLRRFTLPDLVATAEIGAANAKAYTIALRRAGYVRCVLARRAGKGGHAVYMLARNTGPRAPMVRNNGTVWDANSDAVYPLEVA